MAQPSDLPGKNPSKDREQLEASALEEGADALGDVAQMQVAAEDRVMAESPTIDDLNDPESQALLQEAAGISDLEFGNDEGEATPEALVKEAAELYIEDEEEYQKVDPDYQPPKPPPQEISKAREIALRAATSLGTSPEQKQRLLKRMMGKDFDVTVKGDGDLFFRKKGSRKWFPLDPAEMGFTELFADVIADNTDLILEAGTAIATEIGFIAGGTKIGTGVGAMAGGPVTAAVGGAAGGMVGAVVGAPASALAGETARTAALMALGERFEDASQYDRFLLDTGINAISMGLGALAAKGLSKLANSLERVSKQSPRNLLEEASTIRKGFEEFNTEMTKGVPLSKNVGGDAAYNALDGLRQQLSNNLDFARSELALKTSGKRLPVDGYAESAQEILMSRMGVSPEDFQALMMKVNDKELFKAQNQLKKEIFERIEKADVFGDGNAAVAMAEKLIDDLYEINNKGGFESVKILDKSKSWGNKGIFSKRTGAEIQKPGEMQALNARLAEALSLDETKVFEQVYKDDKSMMALLRNAKADYAAKADGLREFKKIFQSKDSSENFVEAIVSGGKGAKKGEKIADLKRLLGEGSEEFDVVRAAWMDNLYGKAINPKTGVVRSDAILKELDKLSENALDALMTKRQQSALRFLVKQNDKIMNLNPAKTTDARTIQDLSTVILFNYHQPTLITRLLWNTFSANDDVLEYLTKDGLLEVTKRDPGLARKLGAKLYKVQEGFRNKVNSAKRTVAPIKNTRLIKDLDELEKKAIRNREPFDRAAAERNLKASGKYEEKTPYIPIKSIGTGETVQDVQQEEMAQ